MFAVSRSRSWALVLFFTLLLTACGATLTPAIQPTLTPPLAPQPTATAAPAGEWTPLDSATCTELAGLLGQTFGLDAVEAPDAFFVDPMGSAEGTGCKATITGTEALFTSPKAVVDKMNPAIQGLGWTVDPAYVAGSTIGIGQGYRKDQGLCLLVATWQPSPDANCPPDKPFDECPLTPEQKIYTVELNCAQP